MKVEVINSVTDLDSKIITGVTSCYFAFKVTENNPLSLATAKTSFEGWLKGELEELEKVSKSIKWSPEG